MPSYTAEINGQSVTFDAANDDEAAKIAEIKARQKSYTANIGGKDVTFNASNDEEAAKYVDSQAKAAPSFLERIKDFPVAIKKQFTGEGRIGDVLIGGQIPANTEAADRMQALPELNRLANILPMARATIGSIATSPQETAQILKANFPNIDVQQDDKGNFWFKSAEDGKWYVDKPGFRASDILRGGAVGAVEAVKTAATGGLGKTSEGASLLSKLGRAGVDAATSQAIHETIQAGAGGSFDPEDVLFAAGMGTGLKAAGMGTSAATSKIKEYLGINAAAKAVDNVPIADIERFKDLRDKIASNPKAREQFAEMVKTSPELAATAEKLGLDLPVSALTEDSAAQKLLAANESVQGSPAQIDAQKRVMAARNAIEQRAEQMGALSPDTMSENVKVTQEAKLSDLKQADIEAWKKLHEVIPKSQAITADNTIAELKKIAEDTGKIPKAFSELANDVMQANPDRVPIKNALNLAINEGKTDLADTLRSALSEMPEYAPRKFGGIQLIKEKIQQVYENPEKYTPTERGMAFQLEKALRNDIASAAEQHGAGGILKESNALHQQRMELQNQVNSGFGPSAFAAGQEQSRIGSIAAKLRGGIESAAKSGDMKLLTKTLQSVPEDMKGDALFSTMMDMAKTTTKLTEGEKAHVFDFKRFVDSYGKLMGKPEAMKTVAGALGQEKTDFFNSVYRVGKAITDVERQRTTTGAVKPIVEILQRGTRKQEILKSALGKGGGMMLAGAAMDSILGTHGFFSKLGTIAGSVAVTADQLYLTPKRIRQATQVMNSPEFKALAVDVATRGDIPKRKLLDSLIFSKPFRQLSKGVDAIMPANPAKARQTILDGMTKAVTLEATKDTKK